MSTRSRGWSWLFRTARYCTASGANRIKPLLPTVHVSPALPFIRTAPEPTFFSSNRLFPRRQKQKGLELKEGGEGKSEVEANTSDSFLHPLPNPFCVPPFRLGTKTATVFDSFLLTKLLGGCDEPVLKRRDSREYGFPIIRRLANKGGVTRAEANLLITTGVDLWTGGLLFDVEWSGVLWCDRSLLFGNWNC